MPSGRSPNLTPLLPDYDGGGLRLTCDPSAGFPLPNAPMLDCTFVNQSGCSDDGDCGAGCSCQCGVCNCNTQIIPPSCALDTDCGPAFFGLVCRGGSCASAKISPWTGTWTGNFSAPSAPGDGFCDAGILQVGTESNDGVYQVHVVGQGNALTFLLISTHEANGLPVCGVPFVASGDTATLIPGSACVGLLGDSCSSTPALPITLDTFLSGSAVLDGGGLFLQMTDVFATPECGAPGEAQVKITSLTATLNLDGSFSSISCDTSSCTGCAGGQSCYCENFTDADAGLLIACSVSDPQCQFAGDAGIPGQCQ